MKISHKDKKLSGRLKTEVPNDMIEEQTKKIPNLVFLGLGLASMAGSAVVERALKRSLFGPLLGAWAPAILLLGVYNKIVKLEEEILHNKTDSLH